MEKLHQEIADAIEEVHPDAQPGDTVELWMTDDDRFSPDRCWYASREAFLEAFDQPTYSPLYCVVCDNAAIGGLCADCHDQGHPRPVILQRLGVAGLIGSLPRWTREITAYHDKNHKSDNPILTRYEVEVPHSPLRRLVGGYYGSIYWEERLSELETRVPWSGTVPQEERDRQEADRAALVDELRQAWRDDPDHPWAWVREGQIEHLDPDYDDLYQWRVDAGAGGDQETIDAITAWMGGDRSLDAAIGLADTVRYVESWQDECAIEQGRARQ